MRLARQAFLFSTFLLIVTGCSSSAARNERGEAPEGEERADTAQSGAATPRRVNHKLREPNEIAPGFELALSNLEDRALNGKFRVDFEGNVKLPYSVTLKVAGLSASALQGTVQQAYRKYSRSPPNVTIAIVDRRYWVDVRGLVEKPGRYLVRHNTSVDEIIGVAGGTLKATPARYLKIEQPGNTVTVKLADYYGGADKDLIPPWYGGDTIYLLGELAESESPVASDGAALQILGEVKNPGEYRFRKNADFFYYLAKAGGPTNSASLDQIEVVRGSAGARTSTTFNLGEVSAVPFLAPSDVVIVHADKPSHTERTIATVSGITAILNTIILTIILLVK